MSNYARYRDLHLWTGLILMIPITVIAVTITSTRRITPRLRKSGRAVGRGLCRILGDMGEI